MEKIVIEDLSPREEEVVLGGRPHVLREASADAVVRYRNAIAQARRFGKDGQLIGVGAINDAEPLVLSLCLHEDNGKGRVPVPEQVIRGWKGDVMTRLFNRLKDISPGLRGDTLESLRKERELIDERIRELEENPEPAKN